MEEYVLLIWEENPEETRHYLIPAEEVPGWVSELHGFLHAGYDGELEEKCMRVHDAVAVEGGYIQDPDDELAGAWAKYQKSVDDGPILIDGSCRVIHTGVQL